MSNEMLIGILSSLIASLMWAATAYFASLRFRRQLRIAFNKVFDTGITFIYESQAEAAGDIRLCFQHSSCIRILSLRGQSFLSDYGDLRFLISEAKGSQTVRLLLADPAPKDEVNYVNERAKELKAIDGQRASTFLDEIKLEIRSAQDDCLDKKHLEFRLHNTPAVFRLMIFDDDLFLSFYSKRARAIKNQVYRCPSSSELYRSFGRYFGIVWESACSGGEAAQLPPP